MPEKKLQELNENFENLLSILAQQTDARSTNLQVQLEGIKEDLEKQLRSKWNWLIGIVISIAIAFLVLGFEMWERNYDRVARLQECINLVQKQQERILVNRVSHSELKAEIADMLKKIDDEREKDLDKLKNQVEKEMERRYNREK